MDQRTINQRAGSARFHRTLSSHKIIPNLQPVPNIRSNAQEVLLVSPFSRSRSRVFYASEDQFNADRIQPTLNNVVLQSPSGSGKFRRSGRRTGSSRKSHDSGFSDSVLADSSMAVSKTESQLLSPARKIHKWSSTSPIKTFLKSNNGQVNGHLVKLSDVLNCCGVTPSLFLSNAKPKSPASNQKSRIENVNEDTTNQTGTPFSGQPSLRGTWPRRRRQQDTKINEPTLNANNKLYHSTKFADRFRSRMKKVPMELNQRVIRNYSVQDWFTNLRFSTEDECTSALQSKAIARNIGDLMVMNARNCKDKILKTYDHYHRVISRLKTVQSKIVDKNSEEIVCCLSKLSFAVQQLLSDYTFENNTNYYAHHYKERLTSYSEELKAKISSRTGVTWEESELNSLTEFLEELNKSSEDLSKSVILNHVKEIIDILEEPPSFLAVKIATSVLSILGIQDDNLSRMVAIAGGVRVLLTVCIDVKYRVIRAKALRSLATLCCVAESICELEQSGGVECVTEILADNSSTEEEKCEASGVIAQITSPTLDYNHSIEGLAENIPCLIRSLTELAKSTSSGDSFLLSTAAIGNLSFFAKQTSVHLLQCETVKVLTTVCLLNQRKCASVFAKDQVATVLVNMASISEGRCDIILNRGIELLLHFLHLVPHSSYSKTEIAALERVQQKSAISISRLCTKSPVAERVVALGGVERLVQMCKDKDERNRSDAVLVACLALVRKIASLCGYQRFKDLNAMELVEPRLLDSFLIYSSKQESYV